MSERAHPQAGSSTAAGQAPLASWFAAHWPSITVWILITAYIAFFGTLTIQKHHAFQTTAFDLGNVDQAVWNTRHGRPFAMTNIEGLSNRLGTHVEPILLPVSLLYFVASDPRVLILLQTVVIALGAWPVYLLAQSALHSKSNKRDSESPMPGVSISIEVLPIIFALVYLLFPALQSANMFDFHAVSLAPTFFLFALYFLETEKWGGYALFAILTVSCKEDMPLLIAMLGLYALFIKRKRVAGLLTIILSAAWFLIAVGWIMPHFDTRGVSPLANRYAYLGDSPLEMAISLLTRPGLVLDQLLHAGAPAYVLNLLAPVAFISILAPQVLMLALPSLMVNLLSTDGFMHQLEGFHYGVTLVPAVVVSAAYGVTWLSRRLSRIRYLPWLLAILILAASLLYHYGHGYTPLAASFQGTWPLVTDHHRIGEDIAQNIPTDASLAALPYPNPHGSQRQQLSMIDRVENGQPAPLHDADYVWLDVTDSWPLHPNDLKTGVDTLLAGEYGLEQAVDGWLLLRRDAPQKTFPDEFFDFARSPNPEPDYAMQLQFLLDDKPVLEALGFDLERNPQDGTHSLTFYWRALAPLPPGLHLYPFYFDDATGQMLEDTSLRPLIATTWYPPEQWQVSEIVATSTIPWDVGATFSIGLGVARGPDWSQVDQRLPIYVQASDQVVRLFDSDTWARLLHVQDDNPVEETRNLEKPSPQYPVDADFGDQIRLLGYDLEKKARDAQSPVHIALYWSALVRPDTSYTVFAQLLDPAGQVRAQVDSVPQRGGYPTAWWLPDEVVVDDLSLELAADASHDVTYQLIVGLYDPASGTRLPVSGTGDYYVKLATIQP